MSDSYGFETMSVVELRKQIADMAKDISGLEADKKEWVGGINETIRDVKKRLASAVTALKQAELGTTQAELEAEGDRLIAINGGANGQ